MVPEVLLLKVGEIFAIPATPQTARLHRWQKGKRARVARIGKLPKKPVENQEQQGRAIGKSDRGLEFFTTRWIKPYAFHFLEQGD